MDDNKTQVDLIADPKKLKEGVEAAQIAIAEFAKEAEASIKATGEVTDKLRRRFEELTGTVKKLVDSNIAMVESAKNINPELIKQTASITALVASLKILSPMLTGTFVAAKAAIWGVSNAFEQTGKKVEVLSASLPLANKLLAECGNDVKKLESRLSELGLKSEDIGIKIVSDWTRLTEAMQKFAESTGVPAFFDGVKETAKNTAIVIGEKFADAWKAVKDTASESLSYVADKLTGFVDAGEKQLKKLGLKEFFKSFLGSSDDTSIDKQVQELERLRALREEMLKESLARVREIEAAEKERARVEAEDIEINGLLFQKDLDNRLEALEKVKQHLINQNEFQTEAGDKLLATEAKLIARKKELIALQQEQAELMHSAGEDLAAITQQFEAEEAAARLANQPLVILKDLLKDAKEEFADLVADQNLSAADRTRLLTEIQVLERRIREETKAEEKKKNEDLLEDAERTNAKIRAQKEFDRHVEKTEAEAYREAVLTNLERQGASDRVLHEQRMKHIEEEHAAFEATIHDEIELQELQFDTELKRLQERNRFAQEQKAKEFRAAEIAKTVDDARQEAADKKRMAALELGGATEQQLHDERMKLITEEEQRQLAKTNDAVEQAQIKANAEKARIAEVTAFELREMEKLSKTKGVLTPKGTGPNGMFTRADRNKALKDAAKARQEALAKAKVQKAMELDKKKLAENTAKGQKKLQNAVNGLLGKDKAPEKGKSEEILTDVNLNLKTLVASAKETNRNEGELIRVVENAGGLA